MMSNSVAKTAPADVVLTIEQYRHVAKTRWLRKSEVLKLLENYRSFDIDVIESKDNVPNRPPSGTLLLYNQKRVRHWRKDGYDFRSPDLCDKLRVKNKDVLKCFYGYSNEDATFQRRSYKLMDDHPDCNIILVHYLGGRATRSISNGSNNKKKPNHIVDVLPAMVPMIGGTRVVCVLAKQWVPSKATLFVNVGDATIPTEYNRGNVVCFVAPPCSTSGEVPLSITDKTNTSETRFLEYGNNTLAQNKNDHTPAVPERAFTIGLVESIMNQNIAKEFSLREVLTCAVDGPGDELLESLLIRVLRNAIENGKQLDLSILDHHGYYMIHYVCGLGYTNLLACMIEMNSKLDINCKDRYGRSPLHLATLAGDGHMVTALLSHGADESVLDGLGQSVLNVAMNQQATTAPNHTSAINNPLNVFMDVKNAEMMIPLEETATDDDDILSPSLSPQLLTTSSSPLLTSRTTATNDTVAIITTNSNSNMTSPTLLQHDITHSLSKSFGKCTLEDMGINTQEIERPDITDEVFEDQLRVIQRKMRWWLYRRHWAAKKLQAAARGMIVRKHLKRHRESAMLIQSVVRQWRTRKKYKLLKKATVQIQQEFLKRHPPHESKSMPLLSSSSSSAHHDFTSSSLLGPPPPPLPTNAVFDQDDIMMDDDEEAIRFADNVFN